VQAVDPVGRSLWSLDVSGERGLFLNHRARTSCVFAGSFDLSGIPLGPFPLLTLPALLLGRVPAVPAAAAEPAKGGDLTFEDAAGRSWAVSEAPGGAVESWTLLEDGAPTVWWLRRDSSAILSDRARGIQLRWREVLSEPLEKDLAALDVPGGYREEPCRETAGPDFPSSPPGRI
jgi:hypothetical protein